MLTVDVREKHGAVVDWSDLRLVVSQVVDQDAGVNFGATGVLDPVSGCPGDGMHHHHPHLQRPKQLHMHTRTHRQAQREGKEEHIIVSSYFSA